MRWSLAIVLFQAALLIASTAPIFAQDEAGVGMDIFESAPGPEPQKSRPLPSDRGRIATIAPRPLGPPPKTTESAEALYQQGDQARLRNDFGEAMRLFRQAADKGHTRSMAWVGIGYERGWNVPRDYAEAMQWFRRAADKGDGLAMNQIGWLYHNGLGVTRDYGEAMRWYRQAAEHGQATAFNNIGVLYYKGFGVPQNYIEAIRWYMEGAARGNAWAMTNMGWLVEHGQGVSKDTNTAVQWYRRAEVLVADPSQRSGAERAKQHLARLGQ